MLNTDSKPGPKTPEGKARALANLRRPWRPGESGNPRGRPPSAGLSIRERINEMMDDDDLTLDKLRALADDPNAHPGDIAAAKWIIGMTGDDKDAFQRLCSMIDYTDGRPTQRHAIQAETLDPRARLEQVRQMLAESGYPTKRIEARIAAENNGQG